MLKMKTTLKTAFLIMLSFFLCGCDVVELIFGDGTAGKLVFNEDCKVNYGDDYIDSTQFVQSYDGSIIKSNQCNSTESYISIGSYKLICPKISTKKMGEQKVEYKISDETYTLTVIVCDLAKPTIELESDTKQIFVGDAFSLDDIKYTVTDNLTKTDKIKCSISGDFDINVAGTYSLEINAKDSSKNKSKKIFTLEVLERPAPVVEEPTPEPPIDNNTSSNSNSGNGSSSTNTNEPKKETNNSGNSSSSSGGSNNSGSSSTNNSTQSTNPSKYNKTFTGSINTTYSQAEDYANSILAQGKAKSYSIQSFGSTTTVTFE